MPSLNGAVALAQVNHVAVAIGQNLKLNVARLFDKLFHVNAGVAKGGFGFALGSKEQFSKFVGVFDQAHAAAPPARRRFDHHRVADIIRDRFGLNVAFQQPLAAGNGGHSYPLHGFLSGGLIAHRQHGFRRWPDEGKIMVSADFREASILGQKAITRMNGFNPPSQRRRNNIGNIQITFAAEGFTDANGFIG